MDLLSEKMNYYVLKKLQKELEFSILIYKTPTLDLSNFGPDLGHLVV